MRRKKKSQWNRVRVKDKSKSFDGALFGDKIKANLSFIFDLINIQLSFPSLQYPNSAPVF